MKYLSLMLLAIAPFIASAQNLHADFFAGIASYQGDLQAKRYTLNMAHPAVGIGLSYDVSSRFVARAGFTYGQVEGNDKANTQAKSILIRNLNFKSNIAEFHLAMEFNLFDLSERSATPYIFGGVAGYHFNPFTNDLSGNKVLLQPLSTEGQGLSQYPDRKPYNLNQLAIPFGGGIKLSLSDNLQVAGEIGIRKLFTDYLDDVSTTYVDQATLLAAKGQKAVDLAYRGDEINPALPYPSAGAIRGGSKYKDWYYFTGLRISYRLNSSGRMGNNGGKVGCPNSVY